MKIQYRFPLIFATSSAAILIGLSFIVYYLSAQFQREEFFGRLDERVEITEQLFLEEDNLAPEIYEGIKQKFLQTLPEETENVYPIGAEIPDSLLQKYPEEFLVKITAAGPQPTPMRFFNQDRQGAGKIYHHQGEDYLVVVTAIDVYGLRSLQNVKTSLVIAVMVSILLLAGLALFEADQILTPISNQIAKARSITARNLHLRLNIYNEKNELGDLATAFNQMLDRLEGAFALQESFISNASHEMRNPLTAIMGEVELALQKKRTLEEYVGSLEIIQKESDRLDIIVDNLLLLAKAGLNPSQLSMKVYRMDELIWELVQEFQEKYPQTPLNLELEFPEEPEKLEIKGNGSLLKIALGNLIDNARKFSQGKPVSLCFLIREGHMLFKVVDQGIGIPKEDQQRILEPFSRAGNALNFHGSGIGLALSHRIIKLHQGNFQLSSQLQKGTTVLVSFPLHQQF
ncbi:MAG: HAMP domain-containing sensor histidine kinase [Bacteroidota bacterium]